MYILHETYTKKYLLFISKLNATENPVFYLKTLTLMDSGKLDWWSFFQIFHFWYPNANFSFHKSNGYLTYSQSVGSNVLWYHATTGKPVKTGEKLYFYDVKNKLSMYKRMSIARSQESRAITNTQMIIKINSNACLLTLQRSWIFCSQFLLKFSFGGENLCFPLLVMLPEEVAWNYSDDYAQIIGDF